MKLFLLVIFFNNDGSFKSWSIFKNEKNLNDNDQFRWMQLRHAIPRRWISIIQNDSFQISNGLFREQTLIRGARCLPMEKFTSKNFYLILLNKISETPTAQAYMERNLPGVCLLYTSPSPRD